MPWNCPVRWVKLSIETDLTIGTFSRHTLASWEAVWVCRGIGRGWVTVTSPSLSLSGTEWVPVCLRLTHPRHYMDLETEPWQRIEGRRTEERKSSIGSSLLCRKNGWMWTNCPIVLRRLVLWLTQNPVGPWCCQTNMRIWSGLVCSVSLELDVSVLQQSLTIRTSVSWRTITMLLFQLCLLLNEVMVNVRPSAESDRHCKSKQPGRSH